jgi:hypothetical protein
MLFYFVFITPIAFFLFSAETYTHLSHLHDRLGTKDHSQVGDIPDEADRREYLRNILHAHKYSQMTHSTLESKEYKATCTWISENLEKAQKAKSL